MIRRSGSLPRLCRACSAVMSARLFRLAVPSALLCEASLRRLLCCSGGCELQRTSRRTFLCVRDVEHMQMQLISACCCPAPSVWHQCPHAGGPAASMGAIGWRGRKDGARRQPGERSGQRRKVTFVCAALSAALSSSPAGKSLDLQLTGANAGSRRRGGPARRACRRALRHDGLRRPGVRRLSTSLPGVNPAGQWFGRRGVSSGAALLYQRS